MSGTAAGRTAVAHLVDKTIVQADRYLADPEHDPFLVPAPPAGWDGPPSSRQSASGPSLRPYAPRSPPTATSSRATCCAAPGRPTSPAWCGCPTVSRRTRPSSPSTRPRIARRRRSTRPGWTPSRAYVGSTPRSASASSAPPTPTEVFRLLRTDPRLRYGDEAEILTMAEAAIRRAEEAVPQWFGVLPVQRCAVSPCRPTRRRSRRPPTTSRRRSTAPRPGTYYANTLRADEPVPARERGHRLPRGRARPPLPARLVQEIKLSTFARSTR